MVASDGTTPTDIRLGFNADSFGTGGAHLAADDLFRGYYYSRVAAAPFTITGLSAGQTYDFYFYSGTFGQDWAADFTLDGHVEHLTAVQSGSFLEGTNYVKFTLPPSTSILAGLFQATGTSTVAVFSGAQIAISASPVPEPGTYALWASGLIFAGAIYRRRRAAGSPADSRTSLPKDEPLQDPFEGRWPV